MVKAKIDPDKCIGCGTCVSMCPEMFEMSGNKASIIKNGDGVGCDIDDIVDNCPVEAISKEE